MFNLDARSFSAQHSKQINWWTDRAEVGTRFCFEDVAAKETFAITCDNFGIRRRDGYLIKSWADAASER